MRTTEIVLDGGLVLMHFIESLAHVKLRWPPAMIAQRLLSRTCFPFQGGWRRLSIESEESGHLVVSLVAQQAVEDADVLSELRFMLGRKVLVRRIHLI